MSKIKVKPRKITRSAFCEHCDKKVEFCLDWMGCVWPTDKGVVTYRELEARCPHCLHEIYVPAVNDVNVHRRNKAYAEKVPEAPQITIAAGELARKIEEQLKMQPSEETERGKEILKEMFEGRENTMSNKRKFTIECEIPERWVNDFCTMLNWMQSCGNLGHSSVVGFHADGDGDFRPKFNINTEWEKTEGIWYKDGNLICPPEVMFDAG